MRGRKSFKRFAGLGVAILLFAGLGVAVFVFAGRTELASVSPSTVHAGD